MMISSLFLVVFLLFGSCYSTKYERTVRYDEEVIIRCPVNAPGIKEFLQSDNVDIWKVTPADGTADVRIHKGLLQEGGNTVAKKKCKTIANVESLVQQFENRSTAAANQKVRDDTWFEEYHNYDEGTLWYKQLCLESGNCTYIESIGTSIEGRDLPVVRIGRGEMKIYFQCLIHAREWISGMVCMYITNYLVENSEDEKVKALLEKVEFVIVPYVNPDGYEYSWTNDRLWRKNRNDNFGANCKGVDLNRNYNDHWNEGGSSPNPCSETYHGSSAASEPETINIQTYYKDRVNVPIVGAIDWHSFGQLLLRPFGWTNVDAPDEARMKEVNDEMSDIIFRVHGKRYTSQKSIGLYPTTGSADDWFYGDDNWISHDGYRAPGITIELRDTGLYGFLLPPDQIIPTGEEVLPAALYFAETYADNPLYYPAPP